MLVTMKEILDAANEQNYAVAAPNVDNEVNARACIEAAEAKNAPLILDVAPQAVTDIIFFGKILRELAQQSRVPIAVNLDHAARKEQVLAAIKAGFTSVMYDKSSLSYEENVAQVKEIAEMVHLAGLSIEGEYGHVAQADNYERDRNNYLTSPSEAANYIKETGVDCLAIAIGTAHGAYPRGFKPYLDFERLIEIKEVTGHFPLVLHGSSGTDEESIRRACELGINKVNIANDLYRAVVDTVKNGNFEGNRAYDVFQFVKDGIKEKVMHMIEVYGSENKAWIVAGKGLPTKRITGKE